MISRGTQRALAFAEDDVHRHLYLVINMKETFKSLKIFKRAFTIHHIIIILYGTKLLQQFP